LRSALVVLRTVGPGAKANALVVVAEIEVQVFELAGLTAA
jgi:hypothetical protein